MPSATCEFCGIPLTPKTRPAAGWPKRICGSVECNRARYAANARQRYKPKERKTPAPPEVQKARRLAAVRRYNERHPERAKAYREKNKEKQREYFRRYQNLHPEKNREASRRWKAAHPEYKQPYESRRAWHHEWYERNREKVLAKTRAYKAAHKEKRRAQCIRRYAKMKGAAGTFTEQQFAARAAMFAGKCWIPGCEKPGAEIDHVIAVSRGGSNWPANLRPICRHHNQRKHNRPWRAFLAEIAP